MASGDHDAGDTYLVMSYATLQPASLTTQTESRIERSGEASSILPEGSIEGEDLADDRNLYFLSRTFDLGASDNTFDNDNRLDSGSGGNVSSSAIFALNLEKFTDSAQIHNATNEDYQATDWLDLINTLGITPTSQGDFFIIESHIEDFDSFRNIQTRMQVDNVDQPTGQTALTIQDGLQDNTDEVTSSQFTMEDLTAALHTVDIDGDATTVGSHAQQRQLTIFSMDGPGFSGGGSTFEQDESDQVVYGDFVNATFVAAGLFTQELGDLVTYGDDVGTLLLNEISTNMTDQVVYGDDVTLVIAIPSNMTDQVFYADFVNATLNVGGAPGGPIIPVPGVTPQGLSLIEWIVYGFFAYGAMLMLMIGIVKEIPGTRTTSLLRIVFILPGIIGAGMLAGPYETIIFPTVDTVNAITLTTENFTETIITTSYIQLQNPVWIIFHYAIMAVMIIYTLSQVLTMLTTAPLEANRNKGNV